MLFYQPALFYDQFCYSFSYGLLQARGVWLGKVSPRCCHPTASLPVTHDMTTFLLHSLHLFSLSVSGHTAFLPVCLAPLTRCVVQVGHPNSEGVMVGEGRILC